MDLNEVITLILYGPKIECGLYGLITDISNSLLPY
jgi:hypothetical protein